MSKTDGFRHSCLKAVLRTVNDLLMKEVNSWQRITVLSNMALSALLVPTQIISAEKGNMAPPK